MVPLSSTFSLGSSAVANCSGKRDPMLTSLPTGGSGGTFSASAAFFSAAARRASRSLVVGARGRNIGDFFRASAALPARVLFSNCGRGCKTSPPDMEASPSGGNVPCASPSSSSLEARSFNIMESRFPGVVSIRIKANSPLESSCPASSSNTLFSFCITALTFATVDFVTGSLLTKATRAIRTVSCHGSSSSVSGISPVCKFTPHRRRMKSVQVYCPLSSSRISMSCMPRRFLPSPSPLSDQRASLKSAMLWCNRKLSSVVSSALANAVPGANFVRSTDAIPSHALPKPAYVQSSCPLKCLFKRHASPAERCWNSFALSQCRRAWNAASALRNQNCSPGAFGTSTGSEFEPRS
mmetsp:Transcript_65257/g.121660  ORF Transcript_65257/g.121660 Transcript_65257/m.121660 type:complete len:353 (+) Transcript_65257:1706-2764(+)